jgi:hypothetical protein
MGDIGEKLRAGVSAEKSAGRVTRQSQLGTEYAEPLDETPGVTQLHWGASGAQQKLVDQGPSVASRSPQEPSDGRKAAQGGGGMAGSSPRHGGGPRRMTPEELSKWADQQIAAERARIASIPQTRASVQDPRLEAREPPPWLAEYMKTR